MKKSIMCLSIFVTVSMCIFMSAYSQEDMTVVDNSVFENPQRVPSLFKHDEHNEAAGIENCNQCHHVYQDGRKIEDESSEDQSCSDCHQNDISENRIGLRKAFHKNCKGCHLEKNKGPIMCGECHIK